MLTKKRSACSKISTFKFDLNCQLLAQKSQKTSGEKTYGQTKQEIELSGHNVEKYVCRSEGEAFNPKKAVPAVEHSS